jgi:hypothetical protein
MVASPRNDATGQYATSRGALLDHLVGEGEHLVRDGKAKRRGRFQIDDELDLARLLDRDVGRIGASARRRRSAKKDASPITVESEFCHSGVERLSVVRDFETGGILI